MNDFKWCDFGLMFSRMLSVAVILFLLSSIELQAQARPVHVVKSGETLFSLSRQYNVTVDDIRKWNNLIDNTIQVNQRLFVGPPVGEQAASTRVRHRVVAGETLFAISRRYGVTIGDIQEWNNLTSSTVEIGQDLIINQSVQNIQELSSEESGELITAAPPPSAYYVVRRGDFLSKIADQFGLTVDELKSINRLRTDNLSVGQVLLVRKPQGLPSVSEFNEGTTPQGRFIRLLYDGSEPIRDIIKKNEMTEAEFRNLNSDLDIDQLRPGVEINMLLPPDIIYKNPYRAIALADTQQGLVSVTMYTERDRGRALASGELYNPTVFTVGHSSIPLGSVIYIENPDIGTGIYVLVNDRIIDASLRLSHAAFESLGYNPGVANSARIQIGDLP